jgi:hypothetical protein
VSEAFKKPFSIFIELRPQSVIDRIDNMKNKTTEIKVNRSDNGDFSLEIRREWGFANPYLRFRVWQPEPNIKFSHIQGEAGAFIHWYRFVPLFLLMLLLPCCACSLMLLTPEKWQYGFGYVASVRQGGGNNWFVFYALLELLILNSLSNILHIVTAPLARRFLLRELHYYLPDEANVEKKKRD